jgi:hypothetical protein
MDIQDEIHFSEQLMTEARKINPQIGYFVKLIGKPLSGDITVELTNGTAKIESLILHEFRRSRKRTPREFIEQVAWSFEPKATSAEQEE